jgi:hypothetical protein
MNKFPKNIYQVWIQGCDKVKDSRFIENMKNWKELNKAWDYHCISEVDLRNACYSYSEKCGKIYDSLKIMHLKIDLGRYVVLYLNGGMYVDMDAYAYRSLDYSKELKDLISKYENENKQILGLSKLISNTFESYLFVSRSYMLNNAIMIASPRNELLKEFIDNVLDKLQNKDTTLSGGISDTFKVHNSTGPKYFNKFFGTYYDNLHSKSNTGNASLSKHSIYIFNPEYFEPCVDRNECTITDNTMCIHQVERSWLSDSLKGAFKVYYFIRRHIEVVVLLLILVILAILYKYKHKLPKLLKR